MASNTPFEDKVNTLQEFLGIPRAQATILLDKYANVEQAMNQFFEDPTGSVRPRAPQNQWEPADNIPYADDTTELPAMSRPPSRVDYHATDMSSAVSLNDEMQDPDLQKAIAMSKEDLSSQETGVVESRPQFGPANRPYYDTNQWAMTTVASSREIVEHPAPAKRQRLLGQPAFLRGSSETGYLAALLNIYHSIPLAREAFLLPSMRVHLYGHDPQWWSGTSDENTKSLSIEASDRGSPDRHNFLAELQCLMAFLDDTNRAYGSVDALADLRAMKLYNSETQLSRLLETWVAAAMMQSPDDPLTKIFTSTAIKAPYLEGYPPDQKDLVCLEPPVRRVEGQTLVNMLDSTIWDDVSDKIDDIWIHQCAEIFTMRLHDPSHENKGLGLEIPAVWYPDRYMYEYREITRQWRREMLMVRQEINQCVNVQRRCELAQGPGKRVIKIRDVLEAASKLSESKTNSPDVSENSNTTTSDPMSVETDAGRVEDTQAQLQTILNRIDEKIEILEQRKRELHQQIRGIASQLTHPTSDPTTSPKHKYYLQGVSTKTNVTYIRRRRVESQTLIDTSSEENASEFEWWRIVWGKDERVLVPSSRPTEKTAATVQPQTQNDHDNRDLMTGESTDDRQTYAVHVVEEDEVIEAAKTESNSIVLVYASENAMSMTPTPLRASLKKFIEQDNRAFQEELGHRSSTTQRRDSQETNTTIMEDVSLDDRSVTPNNIREMTPMSMTSPPRDADGQPSPKRAKSDEAYHVYREHDSPEDEPPPYDNGDVKPQMQERKVNKIGILADQMLEKYGGDSRESAEDSGPIHIEHAKDPLR